MDGFDPRPLLDKLDLYRDVLVRIASINNVASNPHWYSLTEVQGWARDVLAATARVPELYVTNEAG